MIAAGALLLGLAGALAPGFRFRVDPADRARYRDPSRSEAAGVEVVLRTAPDGARVDLLTRAAEPGPRWKWADGGIVSAGRVRLRAPGDSTALVVLSEGTDPGYRLDGPSRWPAVPGEREVAARPVRTIRGSGPFAGAPHEIRIAGPDSPGDPLCESDAGEWQCIGVPRAFSGRVAACRGTAVAGTAEIHPDSPADVRLRSVGFAALLRVETSEPGPGPVPSSVRVVQPLGPRDFVSRPDVRWKVAALGDGLAWIEGDSAPSEVVVEAGAAGHATRRFAVLADDARCVEPIPLRLARAVTLRGSVIDREGSPVPEALVLVRSLESADPGRVVGDGETDGNGEFEISGVEPTSYRIRACHGEHGCAERSGEPGQSVVLRLPGGGAFIGRLLSSAGVPQEGAAVRILPTAKTWTAAEDRLTRLPLTGESGPDGRFRISAPEDGEYLIEARTESSGVARVAVRRSSLSPPVTDLGELRLPRPIEFLARVAGCGSGTLFLSGPLGGETSLPSLSRFRLDTEGAAPVRLAEGGAWTAWATCSGGVRWIEPGFLPDVAGLAGLEVWFGGPGDRSDAGPD